LFGRGAESSGIETANKETSPIVSHRRVRGPLRLPFKGPLHMGHGPVVLPNHRLPGHGPEVFRPLREPGSPPFRRPHLGGLGPVVFPQHEPGTAPFRRPHMGHGPVVVHRPGKENHRHANMIVDREFDEFDARDFVDDLYLD